jgi:quinol-cytochrome oxidoreductase complex cytochrome b subunit
MEDLLNEEDFLSKKSDYNPWKYFRMFYGIAVLHFIMGCVLIALFNKNIPLILLLLVSPCIMAFLMTFLNKRIADLGLKTTLFAVILLLTIYYVLALLACLIADVSVENMGIVTIVSIGYFIFCAVIIAPIIRSRQKKKKYAV